MQTAAWGRNDKEMVEHCGTGHTTPEEDPRDSELESNFAQIEMIKDHNPLEGSVSTKNRGDEGGRLGSEKSSVTERGNIFSHIPEMKEMT